MAPGTEAPAEMHFYFPKFRALCMAENATHNLHNLLTLRGALVRDPHGWAGYLTEAIDTFADRTDVVFASHHWPTWGKDRIVEFLSLQRDLYAYLHDQTLRQLNQGYTGIEIAETFQMPPALEKAWHTHGYYGSVSHNVKAVYQRYMGWFDGNPGRLWAHPPEAIGPRYVEAMGGIDRVVEIARTRLRRRRLPLGGNAARPRDLHRQEPRRGAGVVRRHPRTARVRRRERRLAQLLPVRGDRAAGGELRHADPDGVAVDHGTADAGADVRHVRDQHQRPAGLGSRRRRRRHVPRHRHQLPADAAQRRAGATAKCQPTSQPRRRRSSWRTRCGCWPSRSGDADSPGLEITGDANALPSIWRWWTGPTRASTSSSRSVRASRRPPG